MFGISDNNIHQPTSPVGGSVNKLLVGSIIMISTLQSLILITAGTATSSIASCTQTNSTSCFLQEAALIADCNDTYDNDDPNNQWNWDNAAAYDACLSAAAADKDLCEAGIPNSDRTTLWTELETNLQYCLDFFPEDEPEALEACIRSALDTYMDGLNDLLDPDDDECTDSLPASRLGSIENLSLSPQSIDGKFPVSMMTNLSVQAGVSALPGTPYDAKQSPCIKHAALLAISRNKTGVQIELVSADMDTSDGTTFTMPLIPTKFVGVNDFVLVSLFLDENGDARFAEVATTTILQSPVQGDWNRDGVKDLQDVADYTEFYGLQKKSADLNNDDNVDAADLSEFLSNYTD